MASIVVPPAEHRLLFTVHGATPRLPGRRLMKEPTHPSREPWILTITDEARQSIIYRFMV